MIRLLTKGKPIPVKGRQPSCTLAADAALEEGQPQSFQWVLTQGLD